MPFISKDWRSPGEMWVRYRGGWEMKKCFFHLEEVSEIPESRTPEEEALIGKNRVRELLKFFEDSFKSDSGTVKKIEEDDNDEKGSDDENKENQICVKRDKICPHYPLTLKITKEVAGFNEITEALLRLGFIEALRDVRRFNYVAKVVHSLLRHDRLSALPGGTQRILFRILEEMADVVYESNTNQHVLSALLDELSSTISIYHVWGSHLGSSLLFKEHVEKRRKITEFVENMQIKYKQDLALTSVHRPNLVEKLPEECVREILLRLFDKRDLESASQTCVTMENIVKEKRVWRELVQSHFTKQQIEFILNKNQSLKTNKDWKSLYGKLKKNFIAKEVFSEYLMLCRHCCFLFWQYSGHPCRFETDESDFVPITPSNFLSFFTV